MNQLTKIIRNELRPRFFEYLPRMFPSMEFKQINANKMGSQKHIDGTEGTGDKPTRTYFLKSAPVYLYDSNGSKVEVLTKFQEENGYRDLWDTITELCNMMEVTPPQKSKEAIEAYQKKRERLSKYEASAKRQQDALFSEEGRDTLNYLKNVRGWSEEEIKKAGFGHISKKEAEFIGAQSGVGENGYTLSIPFVSSGEIISFNFRLIREPHGEEKKYKFTFGDSKDLFNLVPSNVKNEKLILVEGEIDALRAEANGITGVVASGGNGLSEKFLNTAVRRGYNKVILLLDRDQAGNKFVSDSIEVAHKKGISVLIAVLPEGRGEDKKNDVDNFFKEGGTSDELRQIIDSATMAGRWKIVDICNRYRETKGADLTDYTAHELITEVADFISTIPEPMERSLACSEFENQTGHLIKEADLLASANKKREARLIEQREREVKQASAQAYEEAKNGNLETALSLMKDALKANQIRTASEKYAHLLNPVTEESFTEAMANKAEGIETAYILNHPDRKKELYPFTLPAGAITMIVAPTSHGKSTMLQNVALQVAQSEGEGATLYFSYEEDKESVTMQFLNKYANLELCRSYNHRSTNLDALRHYWIHKRKQDATMFIRREVEGEFLKAKDNFFRDVLTSGKLRIYDANYYAHELEEAVTYICTKEKVKAVFIDYVQLLRMEGSKKQRNEELKDICSVLMKLSISLNIPIIVAAQANREVLNPLDFSNQRTADAADLERAANKILFVWNTSFVNGREKNKDIEKWETDHSTKLGQEGRMFVKLTKNRGGVVGTEAVLAYNGNTGVVSSNKPKEEALPYPEIKQDEHHAEINFENY